MAREYDEQISMVKYQILLSIMRLYRLRKILTSLIKNILGLGLKKEIKKISMGVQKIRSFK